MNFALTYLRSTTHPSKLARPPALGRVIYRRGGFARGLHEYWDFVTVPPAGQKKKGDKKAEMAIKHLLPRKGLRVLNKTSGEGEVKPEKGENFVIGPSAGGLGTFWWK